MYELNSSTLPDTILLIRYIYTSQHLPQMLTVNGVSFYFFFFGLRNVSDKHLHLLKIESCVLNMTNWVGRSHVHLVALIFVNSFYLTLTTFRESLSNNK